MQVQVGLIAIDEVHLIHSWKCFNYGFIVLIDLLENAFHLCIHGFNYPAGIVFA